MTTITDSFEQAQLSMAAYALDLQSGMSGSFLPDAYRGKLIESGMTVEQARIFANTYTVIDQYNDPNGFSGTVFSKDGVIYFAIRGSETLFTPPGNVDWFGTNFGDIGGEGVAIEQGLAMFNWVQRLYGPVGLPVDQYAYIAADGSIFDPDGTIATSNGIATGELFGQTAPVSVTGHSLGGHLAMMLGRMAPDIINDVYTYNSPGFDEFGADLTSSVFFEVLGRASIPLTGSIGTGWNASGVNTNVDSDIVHLIGSVPGNSGTIFSESNNQGLIDSHGIVAMTDSLSVYNLFATLAANLNTSSSGITTITGFIKASTNVNEQSLEATVNTLSSILGIPGTVTVGDRNSLYTQIQAIEGIAASEGFAGALNIVDTGSLSAEAENNTADGYAYRYALFNLNTFAITGNPGLYLSSEWDAENFTPEYLEDRARFLSVQNTLFTDDEAVLQNAGQNIRFEDIESETVLTTDRPGRGGVGPTRQFIFGGTNDDPITGGVAADRLYGGAGNDTISGGAGNWTKTTPRHCPRLTQTTQNTGF